MSSESMSPYQAPTSDTKGNEPMDLGKSPIPKVFGILHLVFGGLGIVFGLFAIVGAAFTDKIQELQYSGYPDEMRDRMMSAMQPVYETQKWDVISSCFSIVLAVLMIFAGLKLVKYRRRGLKISNIYSALSVIHKLIAIGIVVVIKNPAMQEVSKRLEEIGGEQASAMDMMTWPVAVVIGVGTAIVMSIYPILSFFLLNRVRSRGSLS